MAESEEVINARFEKAKANLIKELNGRDLAQYGDDLDRETSKKMAEYHKDPEVIKMWEEINKRVAEAEAEDAKKGK